MDYTKETALALIAEKIKENADGSITAGVLKEVLDAVASIKDDSSKVLVVKKTDNLPTYTGTMCDSSMIVVLDTSGTIIARILPVSEVSYEWMYEYGGDWRICEGDVSQSGATTYSELIDWMDDHSTAIIHEGNFDINLRDYGIVTLQYLVSGSASSVGTGVIIEGNNRIHHGCQATVIKYNEDRFKRLEIRSNNGELAAIYSFISDHIPSSADIERIFLNSAEVEGDEVTGFSGLVIYTANAKYYIKHLEM